MTLGTAEPTTTHRHLARLDRAYYQGLAFVDWHMSMVDRASGWLTPSFHVQFREILLHSLCRYLLICPVYCLMPDHMHFLWFGVSSESDQRLAMAFLRKHMLPLLLPAQLQKQPYDHVLQEAELERGALEAKAHYILGNPVRARLAPSFSRYEFLGCMIPGYPEMRVTMPDFWERFWRIHTYLCEGTK
jgi:REP element-mobilizing transposase RayT